MNKYWGHKLGILCALSVTACGDPGSGEPKRSPDPQSFAVRTNLSTGGTISPRNTDVSRGDSATFLITPYEGYVISSASGCGGTLQDDSFVIAAISLNCTIFVSFAATTESIGSGVDAHHRRDYAKAMELLRPLAEPGVTSAGNPLAQYLVGKMYLHGQSVDQDPGEAFRWYALSAAQDFADAEYALATMYDDGLGVPADLDAAYSWYKRSAGQGNAYAQTRLGELYLQREKTAENITIGLMWLRTASEQNHLEAQYKLGAILEGDYYLITDLNEAVRYYRLAAHQGHVPAWEAINRITARKDYIEHYPSFLRRLGLTKADSDALFCENFTWSEAQQLREDDNSRVVGFAEKALSRIDSFRGNLSKKLEREGYEDNPVYQELIRQNRRYFENERARLAERKKQGVPLTSAEQRILARQQSGIWDLVYDPAFRNHMDGLSEDERPGLWDYCVSTYMPEGWFTTDIGLKELESARGGEPRHKRIYFATLDYGRGVVDWSRTRYEQLGELDICDLNLDLAGGVAIGTTLTSLLAAESLTMVGVISTAVIAGESAAVIATSTGLLVASAPAIATGVTIAAATGATLYAGKEGYCYMFPRSKEEQTISINGPEDVLNEIGD